MSRVAGLRYRSTRSPFRIGLPACCLWWCAALDRRHSAIDLRVAALACCLYKTARSRRLDGSWSVSAGLAASV